MGRLHGLGRDSVSGVAGDLDNRTAIHDVVVHFYREVVFDDLLAPIFGEVAEVDWAFHIPKLIDYWCRVLLGESGYHGELLAAHRHIHHISPLRYEHFDRWYALWETAVDAHGRGAFADRAKRHAARIGATLARQILDAPWCPAVTHASTDTQPNADKGDKHDLAAR
jgi:hemoglobin